MGFISALEGITEELMCSLGYDNKLSGLCSAMVTLFKFSSHLIQVKSFYPTGFYCWNRRFFCVWHYLSKVEIESLAPCKTCLHLDMLDFDIYDICSANEVTRCFIFDSLHRFWISVHRVIVQNLA